MDPPARHQSLIPSLRLPLRHPLIPLLPSSPRTFSPLPASTRARHSIFVVPPLVVICILCHVSPSPSLSSLYICVSVSILFFSLEMPRLPPSRLLLPFPPSVGLIWNCAAPRRLLTREPPHKPEKTDSTVKRFHVSLAWTSSFRSRLWGRWRIASTIRLSQSQASG